MPLVRMLIETPGRKAGAEHLYGAGEVVGNLPDDLAQYWISEGRAELIGRTGPELIQAAQELEEPAPETIPYPARTIVQLRELAKERGIPYSGKNKAALVAALENEE